MKFFWPHRSKAEGFSKENLTFDYRKRIAEVPTSKISDQSLHVSKFQSVSQDDNQLLISKATVEKRHWANRDFSEYKAAA